MVIMEKGAGKIHAREAEGNRRSRKMQESEIKHENKCVNW